MRNPVLIPRPIGRNDKILIAGKYDLNDFLFIFANGVFLAGAILAPMLLIIGDNHPTFKTVYQVVLYFGVYILSSILLVKRNKTDGENQWGRIVAMFAWILRKKTLTKKNLQAVKNAYFPQVMQIAEYGHVLRTQRTREQGETYLCFRIIGNNLWSKGDDEVALSLNSYVSAVTDIINNDGFHIHIVSGFGFSELTEHKLKNEERVRSAIKKGDSKLIVAASRTSYELEDIQGTGEESQYLGQFYSDKNAFYLLIGIGDVTDVRTITPIVDKVTASLRSFSARSGVECLLLGKTLNPRRNTPALIEMLRDDPKTLSYGEKIYLNKHIKEHSDLNRLIGLMMCGYGINPDLITKIKEKKSGLVMTLTASMSDFHPSIFGNPVDRTIVNWEHKNAGKDAEWSREMKILRHRSDIKVYRLNFTVTEFSPTAETGWLESLINLPLNSVSSQVAKSSAFKETHRKFIRRIEAIIGESRAQADKFSAQGRIKDSAEQQQKAEDWSDALMDILSNGDVFYTTTTFSFNVFNEQEYSKYFEKLYDFIHSDQPLSKKPTYNITNIKNRHHILTTLRKSGVTKKVAPNYWCQMNAWKLNGVPSRVRGTEIPKYFKQKIVHMSESSWALSYPFTSGSFIQSGGLPVGTMLSGEPIIINPTLKDGKRKNGNTVVFGTSGSGKSTLSKKLIKNNVLMGIQTIVLDPENEFEWIVKNIGGDILRIGRLEKGSTTSSASINPLQPYIEETRDAILSLQPRILKYLTFSFFASPIDSTMKILKIEKNFLKSKGVSEESKRRNEEKLSKEEITSRLNQLQTTLQKVADVSAKRESFTMSFFEILLSDVSKYHENRTFRTILTRTLHYIYEYEITERVKFLKEERKSKIFQGKIRDMHRILIQELRQFKSSISKLVDDGGDKKTTPKFPEYTQEEMRDAANFIAAYVNKEAWNQPTTITISTKTTSLSLKDVFGTKTPKIEKNAWMFLVLSFIDDYINSKSSRKLIGEDLSDEERKERAAKKREEIKRDAKVRRLTKSQIKELLDDTNDENEFDNCQHVCVTIDEAHLMIDNRNPIALEAFREMVKRIRKRNGFVMFLTQNVADFVPEGNSDIKRHSTAIINNSQYFYIFNLQPNDLNAFIALQERGSISPAEREFIAQAGVGDCLFISGDQKVQANVNIKFDHGILGVAPKDSGGTSKSILADELMTDANRLVFGDDYDGYYDGDED